MINRREIWNVDFPNIGRHPAVVLTNQVLLGRMNGCTVAVITHSDGPPSTHIALGPESGCDPNSYVNVTDLHTVKKTHFSSRRGELDWTLARQVNRAVIAALDLDSPY